jgi:hypothetical protein
MTVDDGKTEVKAESNENVADMSDDLTVEQQRAASLAERHRSATLAALRNSTSDAARARHARKSWGRR